MVRANRIGVSASIEGPRVRGAILTGGLTLLLFFGAIGAWAGTAPIESAAVAGGVVNSDGYRRVVQHLEGGIIEDILVKNGDRVKRGQILIRLDTAHILETRELLHYHIQTTEDRLALLNEEIEAIKPLLARKMVPRPRMLALQRQRAKLNGERRKFVAQLKVLEERLARAEIRAPISGTVIDLKVNTIGGVVTAGSPLLSIVPNNEPLVIEARVRPEDIDVVRSGLRAYIRLAPFSARRSVALDGRVTRVSADRLTDDTSGAPYYLARVELDEPPEKKDPGLRLYPGMPAEVMIVTGSRSMLSYLIAPLLQSYDRAFREE